MTFSDILESSYFKIAYEAFLSFNNKILENMIMNAQKNLFGRSRTPEQNQLLCTFIQTYWLKPFQKPLPLRRILDSMEYHQFGDQQPIINEGDKIQEYYYLIEGIVNCFKHAQNAQDSPNGRFLKQLGGPQPLGQTVFSHNIVRNATYRAQELVRCCRIKAQTLHQLMSQTLSQNLQFQSRMAQYMGMPPLTVSKLELIRFIRYREFTLRDKVITVDQKRKPVIFFIIKGECRIYGSPKQRTQQEVGLLNLCRHDVIGVEILYEQRYKYSYVVTSEQLSVLEIYATDLDSFPQQFRDKMVETYESHNRVVQSVLSSVKVHERYRKVHNTSTRKSLSPEYMMNKNEVRHLKQLCMYIPIRLASKHKDRDKTSNSIQISAFIQKKKDPKNYNVEMNRQPWSAYLKLPALRQKSVVPIRG